MTENTFARAFRVGIAGPVGSGKTALVDCLSKRLWPTCKLAVVTNDIYTKEDAEFLLRAGTLPAERIRGVETGGCPHAAIREDASMNLEAIADLEHSLPGLQLIFVESGGDNLAAAFSPDLVDVFIYEIDLSPHVGASLDVMRRDSMNKRGDGPFIFTNLKDGTGVNEIVVWLEQELSSPVSERRSILDAHAAYVGIPHSHNHKQ